MTGDDALGGVRVFLVSHYAPAPTGHGGLHRTAQLEHDISALVGPQRFSLVSLERWTEAERCGDGSSNGYRRGRALGQLRRRLHNLGNRVTLVRDNPFRLLDVHDANTMPFSTRGWVPAKFFDFYKKLVSSEDGPKICVIEHPMFGEIVELNARLGIPTVSAFQNLEILDATRLRWQRRKPVLRVMTDLGNELRLLARCVNRLVISKVEAGFLGGLGLECQFYPYLPVGSFRDELVAISRRRSRATAEPGLFVLLGTATHPVTRQSMEWFAERAAEHGLPAGVHVVAVGAGTDTLLGPGRAPSGLELLGFVEQSSLNELLARAVAAVVPQRTGFGALTRLPELACAGVPVITFQHAAHAINPTPGLRIVRPDWSDLTEAMRCAARRPCVIGEREYDAWETQQPRPVRDLMRGVFISA